MSPRITEKIDTFVKKYKKYDDDLFIHQIDRFFNKFTETERHMKTIYQGLKECTEVANEVHCSILDLSIGFDGNVVSLLKTTTKYLEKYYAYYDPQFGFPRYTNPALRQHGETCYDDIITRHFTAPCQKEQADTEMIILWHDLRRVMNILSETKKVLSLKRPRAEAHSTVHCRGATTTGSMLVR